MIITISKSGRRSVATTTVATTLVRKKPLTFSATATAAATVSVNVDIKVFAETLVFMILNLVMIYIMLYSWPAYHFKSDRTRRQRGQT